MKLCDSFILVCVFFAHILREILSALLYVTVHYVIDIVFWGFCILTQQWCTFLLFTSCSNAAEVFWSVQKSLCCVLYTKTRCVWFWVLSHWLLYRGEPPLSRPSKSPVGNKTEIFQITENRYFFSFFVREKMQLISHAQNYTILCQNAPLLQGSPYIFYVKNTI